MKEKLAKMNYGTIFNNNKSFIVKMNVTILLSNLIRIILQD